MLMETWNNGTICLSFVYYLTISRNYLVLILGITESILGDKLYSLLTNIQESFDTFMGVDGVIEETVRKAENITVQSGQHKIEP